MNTLLALLGGVRATVFAGLALLLLVLVGVQSWRLDSAHDAIAKSAAQAVQDRLDATEAARATESAHALQLANIGRQHELERANAQAEHDRLVHDLRTGAQRLRSWWDCPAATVSEADAAAGVSDVAAELRRASAARVIAAADECDAHVRAAQAVIATDRAVSN